MREDYVIKDLVDRAIWDEHFRYKARRDLVGSLREAGFWEDLTEQEQELARKFQSDTSGYSDAALIEELKKRSLMVGSADWGP